MGECPEKEYPFEEECGRSHGRNGNKEGEKGGEFRVLRTWKEREMMHRKKRRNGGGSLWMKKGFLSFEKRDATHPKKISPFSCPLVLSFILYKRYFSQLFFVETSMVLLKGREREKEGKDQRVEDNKR